MDPTTGALIGAIVTALGLLAYNYHRPRVDYAKTGNDALVAAMDQLQEERKEDRDKIARLEERVTVTEARAQSAEARATEAERNSQYLAADMARITDHHLAVVRGVAAGTVPPWPPVPHGQNWLTDADYPPFISPRTHDTGTPGVDPNPPPEE